MKQRFVSTSFVSTLGLALLVAVLSLWAAACGGSDGDDVAADDTETSADAAESSADGGADGGADGAADESVVEEETPEAVLPGTEIRLIAHESFSVSDGLFDNFTLETGIEVDVREVGDAGELVSRAILTAGQPEADVLFGVDNTFLQRALNADLFIPYASPMLSKVADEFKLDPENRVTPIDYGDVCINYWKDALDGPPPSSLADLAKPEFASTFVTQDPESSSPGFAFLLATIAAFGEDGWKDYWQQLTDGGVSVTAGWTDAYTVEFVSGGGPKAIVNSYATSPVAEVLFGSADLVEPPTGVMLDGCFRQIEFAGILAGTEEPDAAALLVDFLLSETFQADIPLNMFVFPVNSDVETPSSFAQWATEVSDPLTLSPAEIEENRSRWTQEWAEIVLR